MFVLSYGAEKMTKGSTCKSNPGVTSYNCLPRKGVEFETNCGFGDQASGEETRRTVS